jgi:hypothetical protein
MYHIFKNMNKIILTLYFMLSARVQSCDGVWRHPWTILRFRGTVIGAVSFYSAPTGALILSLYSKIFLYGGGGDDF